MSETALDKERNVEVRTCRKKKNAAMFLLSAFFEVPGTGILLFWGSIICRLGMSNEGLRSYNLLKVCRLFALSNQFLPVCTNIGRNIYCCFGLQI